jgi:hypothetical protein
MPSIIERANRKTESLKRRIEGQPAPVLSLGYYDVWPGMKLHVQDRNGLRLGPDGEPIVLMPQLTGIETVNMQFFPVNPDLGKPLDNAQSVAVDRGLTFIPQDVYTTATVPEGKKGPSQEAQ